MSRALTTAAISLASLFTFVGGYSYMFAPKVRDNEAALKIVRGELVNASVNTGVKMDAWLPHVEYVELPKFLQTTTVSASEGMDVSIRTKEDVRIYGEFIVKFKIDSEDPNFGLIYTDLKAESIKDIYDDIANYAIPAAIDVYSEIEAQNVNKNLTEIGSKVAARLQEILDDRNYSYIRIEDVVPTGMGLSAEANADLEKIVSERRKLELLEIQGEVADAAIAITEKQTFVTLEALKKLEEAGVPKEDLAQLYYIQLLRDAGKIGTPFVEVSIDGDGTPRASAVITNPDQSPGAPKQIAAPAP